MRKQLIKRLFTTLVIAFAIPFFAFAETVGLFYDSSVEQFKFAAGDIKAALLSKGFTVDIQPLTSLSSSYVTKKGVIALSTNTTVTTCTNLPWANAAILVNNQTITNPMLLDSWFIAFILKMRPPK